MQFYLGTHKPRWLAEPAFEAVPLFVSLRRLHYERLKRDIRARTFWALDSGAFTEIAMHGTWTISARDYAREVEDIADQVGRMDGAYVQDWMVEPEMLEKTGKSVFEHQMLTTRSYLELRDLAPQIPWIPVLQGYSPAQYPQHLDHYDHAGIDLLKEPVVGLGSVCRRQHTQEAETIIRVLYRIGIRLHAFGFKVGGLRRAGKYLRSADSMAWSYQARYRPVKLSGCSHRGTCQNCPQFALLWRRRLLRMLGEHL